VKNWLITGSSRGLGRAMAEAALERGDKVAVTSRTLSSLEDFVCRFGETALPLELDLTDKASITKAFEEAVARFGQIDVVVNNAGYLLLGAIEEMTEAEAREQLETLFFGPLFMTQLAVCHMRERGSGAIVQVSSLAGIGGLAGNSMYAASKWALEGMSEALRREVEGFGLKIIILEPGPIRTDFGQGVKMSKPLAAYDNVQALREQRERWAKGEDEHATGDPKRCAHVLLDLVDRSDPPQRLLLGSMASHIGKLVWRERIKEADAWETVSKSIDFPES
jgi:NAD(P)-dependent dehydrogenase (short-subunit alcohol dehydrogenase family)